MTRELASEVATITMPNTEKSYRLTLVLDTSTPATGNTPVQVVAHSIRQGSCLTAKISYDQAALLLIAAFHEPSVIREYMDALLKRELVEICRQPGNPHLFSADELSVLGIPLDFKQTA